MQYIIKNITTVESPAIIIHGVNCQKVMGSGVALAIANKWPIVRELYISYGSMTLGDIQCIFTENGIMVINCFTQDNFGVTHDKKYALPSAIKMCLENIAKMGIITRLTPLYSPKIGSLRGGLDWDTEVEPIYKNIEKIYPHMEFIICDLK